eukprot:scaffold25166_cov79-Cyclotella_meneghiniana.AAC.7
MTLKRSTSSIFRLVSRVAELGHPSTTILHVARGISSTVTFVRSNLRIGPRSTPRILIMIRIKGEPVSALYCLEGSRAFIHYFPYIT